MRNCFLVFSLFFSFSCTISANELDFCSNFLSSERERLVSETLVSLAEANVISLDELERISEDLEISLEILEAKGVRTIGLLSTFREMLKAELDQQMVFRSLEIYLASKKEREVLSSEDRRTVREVLGIFELKTKDPVRVRHQQVHLVTWQGKPAVLASTVFDDSQKSGPGLVIYDPSRDVRLKNFRFQDFDGVYGVYDVFESDEDTLVVMGVYNGDLMSGRVNRSLLVYDVAREKIRNEFQIDQEPIAFRFHRNKGEFYVYGLMKNEKGIRVFQLEDEMDEIFIPLPGKAKIRSLNELKMASFFYERELHLALVTLDSEKSSYVYFVVNIEKMLIVYSSRFMSKPLRSPVVTRLDSGQNLVTLVIGNGEAIVFSPFLLRRARRIKGWTRFCSTSDPCWIKSDKENRLIWPGTHGLLEIDLQQEACFKAVLNRGFLSLFSPLSMPGRFIEAVLGSDHRFELRDGIAVESRRISEKLCMGHVWRFEYLGDEVLVANSSIEPRYSGGLTLLDSRGSFSEDGNPILSSVWFPETSFPRRRINSGVQFRSELGSYIVLVDLFSNRLRVFQIVGSGGRD